MRSFFYRWFWEGKQKWLILFSFVSFCLWVGAYLSVFWLKNMFCDQGERSCIDLWLHTLGAPFYAGYFLKVLILAPLLLLPFSKLVFKVWATISVVAVPFAFFHIIVLTPLHGAYFDKFAESNLWGWTYMIGTLAIIAVVAPGEWLYKRMKNKNYFSH